MPEDVRTLLTKAQMADGVAALAKSICEENPARKASPSSAFSRAACRWRSASPPKSKKRLGCTQVLVGTIDITQYRDDLNTFQMVPKLEGSDIAFDIDDLNVVLCDEVIYTGRSVRAALDELLNFGRPKRVQLAVLVDRCGREFPVQPDFSALKVTLAPASAWRCVLKKWTARTPAPCKPKPQRDDPAQRPPRHRLAHG
jgi:pyrimidine operon attenuation protein/uracil phosphoribosyltransferase